jgi:hypothetical protein
MTFERRQQPNVSVLSSSSPSCSVFKAAAVGALIGLSRLFQRDNIFTLLPCHWPATTVTTGN